MKYSIYFTDYKAPRHNQEHTVSTDTFLDAAAVYEAMCTRYLSVAIYEMLGNGYCRLIRRHTNF